MLTFKKKGSTIDQLALGGGVMAAVSICLSSAICVYAILHLVCSMTETMASLD
jgi:hypothetical protein